MSNKIINYCLLTANLVAALCIGTYVAKKVKALEKREDICKMREKFNQGSFQEGNDESFIIVGRSIWDINLETDCLYPVTYVKYANKKGLESVNQQVKEAWQKAAKTWEQAAHKWRRSVQNLKNDDEDSELENIKDLDQIADKLTAEMCFNLAQRYITLI